MTWEETALSSENKRLKAQLEEYELINKHHIELIGRMEEQLKAIKYLDRQEVEKIFNKCSTCFRELEETEYVITAICKLAIPSREKIIEVLKKHIAEDCGTKFIWASHIETIADEILGEDES